MKKQSARRSKHFAWLALSIVAMVAAWQVAAYFSDPRLLPGPGRIGATLVEAGLDGSLFTNISITLARVFASFVLAMTIGSAIGIALGRAPLLNRFFDPWLILFLNLPALVIIILCYIWLGLTEVAAITAVAINKIPNVAVTLREGSRALDRDLLEMASVYRFGRLRTLRHVVLPQLTPYFMGAVRSGLALVWKIVLVVELLGRSSGVGFVIGSAFQLFDVSTILAYALAFVAVIQMIEFLILQPYERRLNRWRR
ncbi:ABC transporter permease (plasmid) [Microvirga ossetica]|jgi:NitT/TauT family transport system permease protein|uniref:ABC transporter permease n=1 Tax=Microvirga ossetica TaxID=1882682 RepID=A0A1B2ER29_9HYPH|nr:ABC transporter permease [Microvirga ossetica]ANY82444.1 ABC transporter permease [Microvirga ossetica]